MRKQTFCIYICEKKDADQLHCYFNAFVLLHTIPLLPKSKAIFCDCTAWFVSFLVGIPEDRFSHDAAQA